MASHRVGRANGLFTLLRENSTDVFKTCIAAVRERGEIKKRGQDDSPANLSG